MASPESPSHPSRSAPESVRRILDLAAGRPPTLGETRLICVDGPSGSGKSTLADALVADSLVCSAGEGAEVLRTDAMLHGWHGLPGLPVALRDALAPLAEHRPGRWRAWDWHGDRWARWHDLARPGLLIVEGVGSGSRTLASWITVLVWVEAPEAERLARGVARDGEGMRPHLLAWQRDEDALHAEQDTRARADLVLDTGPGTRRDTVFGDEPGETLRV